MFQVCHTPDLFIPHTLDQDQDEIELEAPENLATALDKKQSKKRVDKS